MNKRLNELDALRGIAALLVVFFHFTMKKNNFDHFFKLGTTGVDLFFMISGFVIFMSLERISKGIDFAINRLSRLYPTYWFSVTFTFTVFSLVTICKEESSAIYILKYLGNMTMFQFYLMIPNLDGPYWTLIIEMNFYIILLILFQLKLIKSINIISVITCSITIVATIFFGDFNFVKQIIFWAPILQFFPLFFAGMVFYKIYNREGKLLQNYLLIVFCLFCQMLLFQYAGSSNKYINQSQYNLMLTIYFLIFTFFVNNKLGVIVNKITLFLGKISYALYLVHQYISIEIIIPFFYNKIGLNFWVTSLFIALPIIILIATFITFKIEVPYSKKMKEKLKIAWVKYSTN